MSKWLTLIVLTASCFVAQRVSAQGVGITDWNLNPGIGASYAPAAQDDGVNRCVGNAMTGGLVIAGGSFLLYKILSAGPTGGDPSKDGGALIVSLMSGTAYAVWKANRCDQHSAALPRREPRPIIRVSRLGSNRVGFEPSDAMRQTGRPK